MERNALKAQAIGEFYSLKSTHPGNVIMGLLDILIDELRIENDTVSPDRLTHSQGKISMCFQLKSYLLRGLPKRPESPDRWRELREK
jgi:hypothetical protein